MKFFLDTEFLERGPEFPLELISIGMVSEFGAPFYAVSEHFNPENASDWVRENVLPHLGDVKKQSLRGIANGLLRYVYGEASVCAPAGAPLEFWGYYSDYDWVVFCQIFGRMIDLPEGFPMYCHDIKQLCDELGTPELPKQSSTEHNALNDAKWNLEAWRFLQKMVAKRLTQGA